MKDTFNRKINYLRISVTDRCDLRCIYCMKEEMNFLPKSQILSGIWPLSWLLLILNHLIFTKFPNIGGNSPVNWLLLNIKWKPWFKEDM